jgi:hypothetical protein
MRNEKIVGALNSAINYLENSIQTIAKNNHDEKAVANSLWLASSEIEYALFLFSMTHPDEAEIPSWKHGLQPKQVAEAIPTMVSALELLKEAKGYVESGSSLKAYEKTWTARNLLLKVTELLDKKRKTTVASQHSRSR